MRRIFNKLRTGNHEPNDPPPAPTRKRKKVNAPGWRIILPGLNVPSEEYFPNEEIRRRLQTGEISANTIALREGRDNWIPLSFTPLVTSSDKAATTQTSTEKPQTKAAANLPETVRCLPRQPANADITRLNQLSQKARDTFRSQHIEIRGESYRTGLWFHELRYELASMSDLWAVFTMREQLESVYERRVIIGGQTEKAIEARLAVENDTLRAVNLRTLLETYLSGAYAHALPALIGLNLKGLPVAIDLVQHGHLLLFGKAETGREATLETLLACWLSMPGTLNIRLCILGRGSLATKTAHLPEDRLEAASNSELITTKLDALCSLLDSSEEPDTRHILLIPAWNSLLKQLTETSRNKLAKLLQHGPPKGIHIVAVLDTDKRLTTATGLSNAARIVFQVDDEDDSELFYGAVGAEQLSHPMECLVATGESIDVNLQAPELHLDQANIGYVYLLADRSSKGLVRVGSSQKPPVLADLIAPGEEGAGVGIFLSVRVYERKYVEEQIREAFEPYLSQTRFGLYQLSVDDAVRTAKRITRPNLTNPGDDPFHVLRKGLHELFPVVRVPQVSDEEWRLLAEALGASPQEPPAPESAQSKANALKSASAWEDELAPKAIEAIRASGRVSTVLIQRKLKVDYERASQLLSLLETHGIISPPGIGGAREILLPQEDA